MDVLPSGTVTFLFTDIEGSTRLLQESGDRYAEILTDHRRSIRAAAAAHQGVEVDTQGDAFLIAFARASDAAAAAIEAQRSLAAGPVRVRMGIHTGEPTLRDRGYVGIDVHRGARICAAGHGGQVLLSDATRRSLDSGVELRDLGEHRLKDLRTPEWLFQLAASGLETVFPPLRSFNNTNLPISVSSFVGRHRELAELAALSARDDVRLLTLTGPGGTGKTRLAISLAASLIERFKNGVFLVELAAIRDPDRVLTTVAQTLGATPAGNETPLETLRRHTEGKTTLLVLDNFEQVLPAGRDIALLLESAPELRLVVTSRERLHVRGEHEYPVAPLRDAEATELFIERARASAPEFQADNDRASVDAICRRLDGLPLAIELAAARVKMLAPSAILVRLERRLPTLTGGARDLPQRQQALRATIDWSFDLLDPIDRRAFARMSVFVSGCSAAAAEAVCGVELDTLGSLLDKSLINRTQRDTDAPRFAMLETIREYAGERLELDGATNELRQRHAEYYIRLVDEIQTGDPNVGALHDRTTGETNVGAFYGRADERPLLDLLARERENLTAALDWFVERGETSAAIRLFLDIARLWLVRGPLHEGRALAEKMIGLDGASDLADFGLLLTMASEFQRWLGDFLPAKDSLERAVEQFRAKGSKKNLAYAGHNLANILTLQGDFVLAHALNEEGLALGRELRDPTSIGHALNSLGMLAFYEADYHRMRELAYEEVAIGRESGNLNLLSAAIHNLAEAERYLGELDAAAGHYEEAMAAGQKLGDVGFIAECVDGLADIAATRGDMAGAVPLWAASNRLLNELSMVHWNAEEQRRGLDAARQALGQRAFEAAWSVGRAMDLADMMRSGAALAKAGFS